MHGIRNGLHDNRIELRFPICRVGNKPTNLQKVDIAKRRERLRVRIDAFNKMGMTFLAWNPTLNENQMLLRDEFDMDDVLQMDDDLAELNLSGRAPDIMMIAATKAAQAQAAALAAAEAVEHVKIALPSAMGEEHLQAHGLNTFCPKNISCTKGKQTMLFKASECHLPICPLNMEESFEKSKKVKSRKQGHGRWCILLGAHFIFIARFTPMLSMPFQDWATQRR